MAEADKVTLIPLNLSITEWQLNNIINNTLSTDYPIPKDAPSLVIAEPTDPKSNGF